MESAAGLPASSAPLLCDAGGDTGADAGAEAGVCATASWQAANTAREKTCLLDVIKKQKKLPGEPLGSRPETGTASRRGRCCCLLRHRGGWRSGWLRRRWSNCRGWGHGFGGGRSTTQWLSSGTRTDLGTHQLQLTLLTTVIKGDNPPLNRAQHPSIDRLVQPNPAILAIDIDDDPCQLFSCIDGKKLGVTQYVNRNRWWWWRRRRWRTAGFRKQGPLQQRHKSAGWHSGRLRQKGQHFLVIGSERGRCPPVRIAQLALGIDP